MRSTGDFPSPRTLDPRMRAHTPAHAYLAGTRGGIEFAGPWYLSPQVTVFDSSGHPSDLRTDIDALCFEAAECARVIHAGGTRSPLMPPSESVSIMTTLAEVLRQVHS